MLNVGLLGVAGMITSDELDITGSFPKIPCVKRTSEFQRSASQWAADPPSIRNFFFATCRESQVEEAARNVIPHDHPVLPPQIATWAAKHGAEMVMMVTSIFFRPFPIQKWKSILAMVKFWILITTKWFHHHSIIMFIIMFSMKSPF